MSRLPDQISRMTIHYHGTPITPRSVLHTLSGKHFCVSFYAPNDVAECHKIGQSVMLDNGAFSHWRLGTKPNWDGYYDWVYKWTSSRSTWAVIPDVIGGSEDDNDELIRKWPHGSIGSPVWHLHESIGRLERLCSEWPRVCFGSSAQFSSVGSVRWTMRMNEAFNVICKNGRNPTWLHMLRGMKCCEMLFPFDSVDSADVARNHNLPHNNARKMADRWDAVQCPISWDRQPEQGCMLVDIPAGSARVAG